MAITPMAMLNQAVAQGAGIEVLTKLMDLQDRYEATQARKAFDEAIAAAKAEIPTIFKNRLVDFTGKSGIRTHYRHEDLGEIARTVDPILSKHGLSYRWSTASDQAGVTVTCIVSHRDGHVEKNTLTAGRDESGNKNHIQAIGSAITFLQRYTLKAALGLAASNDDDGKSSGGGATVTPEQATAITDLALEVKADMTGLLEFFDAPSISDIGAKKFAQVIAMLNQKKARASREAQS